ncbi:DUF3370 family protein [Cyanobium sp. Alchichica 3B3-8F6]|uniref:DUF3370 family protein n=1 Tax=Cyanobium sp. Alchichica 3B3-8F6 TaxID=2823696 RepID=UPI0020CFDB09|nr:DUF3370 family protein [Cyanobium sp. Alchichica 3B3-8F6]MCP9882137.1 DUF3370 family protein [Cyanobium sp. Alchichica 3B3-8F6]
MRPFPWLMATALGVPVVLLQVQPASAYVALMAGQQARPLNGSFNKVPVLHSNQPEEVEGAGILINTAPGYAYASETGQPLRNAEYTFNGEFGVHMHHKYFPPNRGQISASARRPKLTLGLILINPGARPVHIRFENGAVRNSFEAPYLQQYKMGVRPLGPRPWNTGPGDATAIQVLRGRLDSKLSQEITIPARSRIVLFQTQLPALGIANALLKGRSDGPFQMAVVAAKNPQSDWDVLAVLDRGRLAPGRVYLNRIADINRRRVFSRVGGVAIGDGYGASLDHDLTQQGPLHVPLTSTHRHNFGTREVQVNPLVSRMVDSSLDNVGTYGVRFDVDLNLKGSGPYELVLSHPSSTGSSKPFTAFRGSFQVRSEDGLQEMHAGLRSGQSVALTTLNLRPGVPNPVRVSLVYPADATPGHLLSVVPASQLTMVQNQERQLEIARSTAATTAPALIPIPPAVPDPTGVDADPAERMPPLVLQTPLPGLPPLRSNPPPPPPPAILSPRSAAGASSSPLNPSLVDRYQQALEAQQQMMRSLMDR